MNFLEEMNRMLYEAGFGNRIQAKYDISGIKRVEVDKCIFLIVNTTGMASTYLFQTLKTGRVKMLSKIRTFDLTTKKGMDSLEEFWSELKDNIKA